MEPGGSELSLRQVLMISAVLYALFLPIAAVAQWFYVPLPFPDGEAVELLTSFKRAPDGRYFARTFRFVREKHVEDGKIVYKDFAKPKPIVIYEDMAELPRDRYEIQQLTPSDTWRYVWINTINGEHPRDTGHRYYVVLPRQHD